MAVDTTTASLEDRVKGELEKIRQMIQLDGGDIEFMGMRDATVQVRLKGACAGCPGAQMTLKMGVERRLKQVCPEISGVESI